ncbi:hypothetical protein HYT53_04345 [Candidatus Woesearchaeota archaeon]|nr:hypothetical protein [Candidatus Woesearchaeota archaeon]
MTSKTSALYEAGTGQEFEVNFYKKGNFRRTGPNISQEAWIDMRDFDVFTVYEFDEQKNIIEKPTASGYFKEGMMLVLYDLFTKRGNKITKPVPDGYVEDSSCYSAKSGIMQVRASQLIADVVEVIAKNRHNKKYENPSLKPNDF